MAGSLASDWRWWVALSLDVAWKSAAVLAAAGLVCLALRRSSAATRHFEYLATPGPDPFTGDKTQQAELAADAEYMPNVDRKHYWGGMFTDAEGRITLPSLIPGARYRISDFSTVNDRDKRGAGPQGLHRQAGRDSRPGRHPHREAARLKVLLNLD